MKNKFLLLLILGVTFFAACNDDDDDPALVGKWKLGAIQVDGENSYQSGPLFFKWVAEEGTTILGDAMEVNDVAPFVESIANPLLVQVLKDVTFQNNGQIVATYSDAGVSLDESAPVTPVWKTSPAKYLSYKIVSGNKLTLYPNIVNILKEVDMDLSSLGSLNLEQEDLAKLLAFVEKLTTEGISASYVLSDNDKKFKLSIDKALCDQLIALLPVLSKLLPENLDGVMALIPVILGELPQVWAKTTTFEIGLNLEK